MKTIFVLLCSIFASVASAQDQEAKVEWRVLGPAFAWHGSTHGAPITSSGVQGTCETQGQDFIVTDDQGHWTRLPAVQHCDYHSVVKHGWTNINPALGFERTTRYDDHSNKLFAGIVRDSYGQPSAMVGAARVWPLYESRVRIEAGVTGVLWYRTIGQYADTGRFDRKLVPLVLPVLSINDTVSKLGLNVSFVPAVTYKNHEYSVNTLMVQSTYQF